MRSALARLLTELSLGIVVVSLANAAEPTTTETGPKSFCLAAAEPDSLTRFTPAKLLVREILRQAVLLAAREELGLATRDMTLRESMAPTDDANALVLDAHTAESEGKFVRLRITRGEGDAAEVLYEKELPYPSGVGKLVDYAALVVAVEPLTRTEIPDALRKAGMQGNANKVDKTVLLAERSKKRLAELNFFSQMAALREVHKLVRDEGESAQTLAALVRVYANLGQLTKFHWNASHKAFAARSLLYAQRLVARDEQSPWSLQHRAYAEALAGLHAAALADLKAATPENDVPADEMLAEGARPPLYTHWVPLIEALCRYDAPALEKPPADDDLAELAALCAYLVVENSNCESMALTAGRKALEVVPECYAICDSMDRYSGVINRHTTTVQAPMELGERIKDRLRQFSDLPAGVNEELRSRALGMIEGHPDPAWAGGAPRAALVKSLVQAGAVGRDTREPSWELLGRLLEDITIVHVFRRLEFFHDGLGLPSSSYRDQLPTAFAAVADHPYLPLAKTAILDPQRDVQQIAKLLESSQAVDLGLSLLPVHQRIGYASADRGSIRTIWWDKIWRHTDHTAEDLERMAQFANAREFAHLLQTVSPHSPQAIALLVANDPEYSQDKLVDWEKDGRNQAVVCKALGLRYSRLGQSSDAERCLQRYIELSPDQWGFGTLADVYWKQKQTDKWQQTLEESLKHEDFALSHANTQVKLARYFMGQQDFHRAQPYANAAAQSGAAWAMICAADCHEGLENWDQAEELVQATAERYSDSRLDWFFWCCRTGHGHKDAAQRLAKQIAPQLSLSSNGNDWDRLGVYHLLCDKQDLAKKAFAKAFEISGQPYSAIHLALLEDQAGNTAARDAALVGAVDRGSKLTGQGNLPTANIEFAKWLNDAYHQPADAAPNVAALDEQLKTYDVHNQANLDYFAGRYLHDHGHDDLAREYLEKCLATRVSKWNLAVAGQLLREMTPSDGPQKSENGSSEESKPTDGKEY
ncbi:MAG TPA: hypothetical protein VGN12_06235 [Pirellulales bacterium]|jgi:tetratricopeptide (TPR) repeat protein